MKMREIKIKWAKPSWFGSFVVCCMTKEMMPAHGLESCKDYVQDCVAYGVSNRLRYGWSKPSLCPFIVLFGGTDIRIRKSMDAIMDFVHQVEEVLKIRKTEFYAVTNNVRLFVANASVFWTLATPTISLYTTLLRTGNVHQVGKPYYQTLEEIVQGKYNDSLMSRSDAEYLRTSILAVKFMLCVGVREIFGGNREKNYPADWGGSHGAGIVGFSQRTSKLEQTFPHWYSKYRQLVLDRGLVVDETPIDEPKSFSDIYKPTKRNIIDVGLTWPKPKSFRLDVTADKEKTLQKIAI